jgi:SAM-dependent MidA family methyltransferase
LTAAEGDIAELRDHCELAANLARLARNPFAGLFIDYGHAGPAVGDTLQAVRHHAYVDPLALPGQTDLTAQVDFPLLRDALAAAGLAVEPILPQGELLGRLGILDRARRLAHLNPQESNSIEMAVARLVSPAAMGQRFKALAVRSRDLAPLPGFHSPALPCSP